MSDAAWKPAAWIAAAALVFVLAMSGWAAAGGTHVRGAVTWYKPSGHDAATTHGTRNLTLEDGAVLLLEFSYFIRERDGWECTGREVLPGVACAGRLQAAHILGRNAKPTKYDPINVHTPCKAHHTVVDSAPGHEAFKFLWAVHVIGEDTHRELVELAAQIGSVRRVDVLTEVLATYPPRPEMEAA